jgi:hypothetical protein
MRDRNAKGNIVATVVILMITAAILLIVVNSSGVETTADSVVLKGIYGKTIPYSSITQAELYEADLPVMMVRVNGISLGFIEIGRYRLADIGAVRMFVLKRQKPYLLLHSTDETILLGLGAEKNRNLLDRIQKGEDSR